MFNDASKSVTAKFRRFEQLLQGVRDRRIRGLIVRGRPGVGKTHEIGRTFASVTGLRKMSGHVTPLSLYNTLYAGRDEASVTVFDDCDDVFQTGRGAALNILKASTDSGKERVISWESTGRGALVPRFAFWGRIIVLTNVDLGRSDKYAALLDRVVYYDMQLTGEEVMARVVWVMHAMRGNGMIRVDDVLAWLMLNWERMRGGISVRGAMKVLDVAQYTEQWSTLAKDVMLVD